jgi:hypothetical protein
LAICLEKAEQFQTADPENWDVSVSELKKFTRVVDNIRLSRGPSGERMKKLVSEAGLIERTGK